MALTIILALLGLLVLAAVFAVAYFLKGWKVALISTAAVLVVLILGYAAIIRLITAAM